jgi:hypothetical protein
MQTNEEVAGASRNLPNARRRMYLRRRVSAIFRPSGLKVPAQAPPLADHEVESTLDAGIHIREDVVLFVPGRVSHPVALLRYPHEIAQSQNVKRSDVLPAMRMTTDKKRRRRTGGKRQDGCDDAKRHDDSPLCQLV